MIVGKQTKELGNISAKYLSSVICLSVKYTMIACFGLMSVTCVFQTQLNHGFQINLNTYHHSGVFSSLKSAKFSNIRYSAYRTAMKLREVQKTLACKYHTHNFFRRKSFKLQITIIGIR